MENVLSFIQSNSIVVIAGLLLVIVEYILGKTTWVKSGSTLELILNGAKKLFSFLKQKA